MSRLSRDASLQLALAYVKLHPTRYLHPLVPGGKLPLIKDYANRASNTEAQLTKWADKWKGCNWGIAPGKSGIAPVDIDTKAGKVGAQTVRELEAIYGEFPATEEVQTPSGGRHLYYTGEWVFALGEAGFGKDIDSPQYLVIPGSRLDDGGAYVLTSFLDEVAPAPAWFYNPEVLGKVKERKNTKIANVGEMAVDSLDTEGAIDWATDMLRYDADPAIENQLGNSQTWKIAAQLRGRGISQGKAEELMAEFYNPRCDPPWEIDELNQIIANAYAYANQERIGEKSAQAEFREEVDIDAMETEGTPEEIAAEIAQRQTEQETRDDAAEDAQADRVIEAAATGTPVAPPPRRATVASVLREWVYVAGIDQFVNVAERKPLVWKRSSFDNFFANLDKKKVSEVLLKAEGARAIRKFEAIGYQPGAGLSVNNGKVCNLYRPSDITPTQGDTAFWDQHLEFLFPDQEQRDHLLNWLAWFVQNISRKPKHALLIQGRVQGTGKSFIPDMLAKIIGKHNVTAVSQSDLGGSFNGYAMRTKMIVIEELRAMDKGSVKAALHDIITQDTISINEKNMPKFEMENCFGVIAMTNDDAAITLDLTDRRYLVLRTEATARDVSYYDTLYATLNDPVAVAAVAYALQTRDVGAYNGAGRAPLTEAKSDMITTGFSELETWMIENRNKYPLSGRVTCVRDVAAILPPRLERLPRLTQQIATALRAHFKAKDAGQPLLADGSRPRLFVINGCPVLKFANGRERAKKIYELDFEENKSGKITQDNNEFLTDDPDSDMDNIA